MSGNGRTVLLVDDDAALRMLCRVNLELDGFQVLEAPTVDEAAGLAGRADVVILDVRLGDAGTGGLALLDRFERAPPPAVLVLTGSVELSDLTRPSGVSAVMTKPFELSELRRVVSELADAAPSRAAVPAGVLDAGGFEERLRRYRFERMEEGRAVRVGEKETSASADIVARYADLFTPEQLEALHTAEAAAEGGERERLYRLRKSCEYGLVERAVATLSDEVENAILAARVDFRGEELPLRSGQAKLAVLTEYRDRDELGALVHELSASFNDRRLELLRLKEDRAADVSGQADPVARSEEEKGIVLAELSRALQQAGDALEAGYRSLRERWLERLLGPEREDVPSSAHVGWLRRLSPLEATYTRERCVEVCLDTLRRLGLDLEQQGTIRLDLDDRPQKSPRACVIPSDPPEVVHLITRAQGGLHDYGAFLHEAGHALHYAGSGAGLDYTFRAISRDHALTEIYSYILEAISREPGWHERYFGLTAEQAAENAEAADFVELFLFKRYEAKLRYELEFWSAGGDLTGMPERYSELLTEAAGIHYPPGNYLADMDDGFYSADYLRAWIRSSQLREWLRRELGEGWWQDERTGDFLRELWAEGTRPTSEEVAGRIGYDPLDTAPLVASRG